MSGNMWNSIRSFFQKNEPEVIIEKYKPAPAVEQEKPAPIKEKEKPAPAVEQEIDIGAVMERKKITFIVTASVEHESDHAWQSIVRYLRKTLKEHLGQHPAVKILRIESKEG